MRFSQPKAVSDVRIHTQLFESEQLFGASIAVKKPRLQDIGKFVPALLDGLSC